MSATMQETNPIRKAAWIAECAWDAYRNRGFYRSASDPWKIFMLRIAAGTLGLQFFGGRDRLIDAKIFDHKIALRPGTHDIFILKEIVEWGEYAAVVSWGLPEDANIVDLGGNIGLASLYFASLWPRSKIIIVEPDPTNLRVLEENCRVYIDTGRMSVVQAFVAGADGQAGIDRSLGSLGTRMMPLVPDGAANHGEGEDRVACVSFPTLLQRHPMPRIDLLKCDIEGAEADLFRDCREWIDHVQNLIVETHRPDCSPDQLYDMLRSNGWDFDLVCEDRERDRCTSGLRRRSASVHPHEAKSAGLVSIP
jgi:FkbM family methyltransferase